MLKFETPLVLGIETSCDDTACALLDGRGRVLASVVSSQLKAHRPYGGVVPEIASREHLAGWPRVRAEAFTRAGLDADEPMDVVGVVAATRGPGLVGSLLVGLSLGKAIAFALNRPFHAVHHLEGHLYSPYLRPEGEDPRPIPERFLGLVVSGGHTSLFEVDGAEITTLAETRDDAMGEVFDKVGKRLGLPYPQGPVVDRLAERGDAEAHPLPIAYVSGALDFSYSGLKTQALLAIEELERQGIQAPTDEDSFPQEILNLLAGFRAAATGQILHRLRKLHRKQPIEHLAVSGGAAANRLLRRQLEAWAADEGIELALVPLTYAGDNAAMIAHAALLRHRRGITDDPITADAASRIPI